ncbi:PREDICTED: C-C motif chemokine 16 [Odobenus rosmarus divergens]|uniref:C-C motif chemokine 16 n=1 Tax=Odobenus rosmarus divergens TaxID=9708 RepID=A0A2U3WYT6_ODORO|nr:PREDICTED: C-C motif chemokine 16 [Odobenus rosmarus divergens]
MKVSGAALFLLILILTTPALHDQSKSPESLNSSHTCCLKYHEKVMPKKLVVGYRKALNCYLPAIIFVTKKNREVCANPQNEWVQEYIKDPNIPLLPPRNLAQVKSIRP